MNIATLLARSAGITPDAPALAAHDEVEATYAELLMRVQRLAGGLAGRGVGPGTRVALFMGNSTEYFTLMLAVWWAGAAVVPVNAKLHPRELAQVLEDAEPALLFTGGRDGIAVGSSEWNALAQSDPVPCADVDADDLAWLFFTSGTTGRSKGAMISHGNLLSAVQAYFTDVDAVPPGAAMIHAAPMSHGSGLYALPFLAGGGVQVVPRSGGFDASEFFAMVKRWPNACTFAAPTMISRLVAAKPEDVELTNLRTIISGGAPLYAEDRRAAVAAFGPRIAQIYGQGECPMTITAQSRERFADAVARGDTAYLDTTGAPFAGTHVVIRQADGRDCGVGEIGEVTVRSAAVICGYWRNEDATKDAIRDGWLWTGDQGFLDARGLLTLSGRSKETIITGGSNVYPIEVENVLLAHPNVREAAVVGRRNADWGEVVTAYVVVDGDGEILDAWCREHLAAFKCPKVYEKRQTLPKNAYGKVAKLAL